jgi:hypothetical protein
MVSMRFSATIRSTDMIVRIYEKDHQTGKLLLLVNCGLGHTRYDSRTNRFIIGDQQFEVGVPTRVDYIDPKWKSIEKAKVFHNHQYYDQFVNRLKKTMNNRFTGRSRFRYRGGEAEGWGIDVTVLPHPDQEPDEQSDQESNQESNQGYE